MPQQRQQAMGELQGGRHIQADQGGNIGLVMLLQQAEAIDPGGINQGVHPTKAPRCRQHSLTPAGLGDVRTDQLDLTGKTLHQAFQRRELTPRQQQLGAALTQPLDQRLTNATTGTGNQRTTI